LSPLSGLTTWRPTTSTAICPSSSTALAPRANEPAIAAAATRAAAIAARNDHDLLNYSFRDGPGIRLFPEGTAG